MLKQHKVIRWESLNAPKNSFQTGPTRVLGMEEAPSASTNTTLVPDSMATINDRFLCDSANMKQPALSSAETRGKQISASEKPTTVSEKPCQPRDSKCFLDRGKNSRAFGPCWFDHDEWKTWLHYDQNKDTAFCFTCIKAIEQNLISSKHVEKAFICAGYKNWSDAGTNGRGFDNHHRSDAHTGAHQRLYIIPQQYEDIGEEIFPTYRAFVSWQDRPFHYVGMVMELIQTSLSYISSEEKTIRP